jgi:hypothetical protein
MPAMTHPADATPGNPLFAARKEGREGDLAYIVINCGVRRLNRHRRCGDSCLRQLEVLLRLHGASLKRCCKAWKCRNRVCFFRLFLGL